MRPSSGSPRRALAGALLLVITCLGTGAASAGIARYTDVPATHPFYAQIEAVSEGCVMSGYADGTFKPSAGVTRQAVAAFLARGLPALHVDRGTDVAAYGGTWTPIASTTFTVPNLPDCEQHAQITGRLTDYGAECGGSEAGAYLVRTTLDGAAIAEAPIGATNVTLMSFADLAPGAHTAAVEILWSCLPDAPTDSSGEIGVLVTPLGSTT